MRSNPLHSIPNRLKTLRDRRGVTQDVLAAAMGFNDRQTLAKIEANDRRISAEELARAADFLSVPVGWFTDPFRLDGEARFSWRRSVDVEVEKLSSFEELAGSWIALYRELARQQGLDISPFTWTVPLRRDSSFEDAWSAAEKIAKHLDLGATPATTLRAKIEGLGILVLYVDSIPEVSGAAIQLGASWPQNVILINRNEHVFRRNFDLAHEFFHLLTWDAMPPEHVESLDPKGNERRIEQLADNFSASLLIPNEAIAPHLERRGSREIHEWLNETATLLNVSAVALWYRLLNGQLINPKMCGTIDENRLRHNGRTAAEAHEGLPLFSRMFLAPIAVGIDQGSISVRRVCSVLQIPIDRLALAFEQHGIAVPFSL